MAYTFCRLSIQGNNMYYLRDRHLQFTIAGPLSWSIISRQSTIIVGITVLLLDTMDSTECRIILYTNPRLRSKGRIVLGTIAQVSLFYAVLGDRATASLKARLFLELSILMVSSKYSIRGLDEKKYLSYIALYVSRRRKNWPRGDEKNGICIVW